MLSRINQLSFFHTATIGVFFRIVATLLRAMTALRTVWESPRYRHALVNYIAKKHTNRVAVKAAVRDIIVCGLDEGRSDAEILRAVHAVVGTSATARVTDRRRIIRVFCTRADTYLDFGCGDATITREIARAVGATTAYGVDVYPVDALMSPVWICGGVTFGGIGRRLPRAEFARYASAGVTADVAYLCSDDMDLLEAGSVDLCTMFMTLHHLAKPVRELCRLRRLLRIGGRLVIREHDCQKNDVLFAQFLNAIHTFNCDDTPCYYAARDAWVSMVVAIGFRHVSSYCYCEPNPHRVFYACFVKVARTLH